MKEYSTKELAREIGIHPNTVRLYEQIGFLPIIPRKDNGYRIYNQIHLEQLKLIRIALKSELLQNGLRKKVIQIIKVLAKGEYDTALLLSKQRLESILKEKQQAEEAIEIAQDLGRQEKQIDSSLYTRQKLADYLDLTIDTLRNWELNGLLKVKRKSNGYRVYNEEDIKRIKMIRSLRCANFSLSSILRLLNDLDENPNTDIKQSIDNPKKYEDIISVYDKLLTSLENAKEENKRMIEIIKKMKRINPPV